MRLIGMKSLCLMLPCGAHMQGSVTSLQQVVGSIWDTFSEFSTDSISMPRAEFARELCCAVHDRDHVSLLGVLGSRPELALYQRVYEGPGFRQYLQRSTHGQRAAQMRFQLRSGTSMLRQHDS